MFGLICEFISINNKVNCTANKHYFRLNKNLKTSILVPTYSDKAL